MNKTRRWRPRRQPRSCRIPDQSGLQGKQPSLPGQTASLAIGTLWPLLSGLAHPCQGPAPGAHKTVLEIDDGLAVPVLYYGADSHGGTSGTGKQNL